MRDQSLRIAGSVESRSDLAQREWTRSVASGYLAAFAATFVLSFVAFYLVLGALALVDRLPAPPVSGTWCIDEKLVWLGDHRRELQSGVVAVGSSVTMRDLDFSALPEETREASGGTINAAPCFLQLGQTRFFANFLLDHQPKTHTVITIVAGIDFENCTTTPKAFFDYKLGEGFLYRYYSRMVGLWVYYRNLRPISFMRDVRQTRQRRLWEVVYDGFGSAPLTTDGPNFHHPFMRPHKPEAACFEELRGMARDLRKRGIQLIVVTFPTMPRWAEEHDSKGEMTAQFLSSVRSAVSGTGAILVDATTSYPLPTEAFTDPAHLQWREVARFTRFVWEQARQLGAKLPAASVDGEMALERQ
jgi:hypothetical protein